MIRLVNNNAIFPATTPHHRTVRREQKCTRHASSTLNLLAAVVLSLSIAGAKEPENQPPQRTSSASAPSPELLRPEGQAKGPVFDPTSSYDLRDIEGWPVRVNQKLLRDEPKVAEQTLELVRFQFYQIRREVPAQMVEKLQKVTLWVELNDPLFPCMCYHENRGWVAGHGLNPQKTKGVELANPKTFLKWVHSQPWMVFHEYAHAYHDQFLPDGFANSEILSAFHNARDSKIYDAILRNNGRTEKAYAMTNQMEYFAELSESFFGTNDFYPFVRAELKVHDPKGYEVLKKIWDAGKY